MGDIPELKINNLSALDTFGVRMGDGFVDTLTEPLSLKENVENESRLEHGKRVIVDKKPKYASREILLDFTITGISSEDFLNKKNGFLTIMYKGKIKLEVPQVNNDVYNLIYRGKGTDYGMNVQRTFCHMMLKFEEPNPANRAE